MQSTFAQLYYVLHPLRYRKDKNTAVQRTVDETYSLNLQKISLQQSRYSNRTVITILVTEYLVRMIQNPSNLRLIVEFSFFNWRV